MMSIIKGFVMPTQLLAKERQPPAPCAVLGGRTPTVKGQSQGPASAQVVEACRSQARASTTGSDDEPNWKTSRLSSIFAKCRGREDQEFPSLEAAAAFLNVSACTVLTYLQEGKGLYSHTAASRGTWMLSNSRAPDITVASLQPKKRVKLAFTSSGSNQAPSIPIYAASLGMNAMLFLSKEEAADFFEVDAKLITKLARNGTGLVVTTTNRRATWFLSTSPQPPMPLEPPKPNVKSTPQPKSKPTTPINRGSIGCVFLACQGRMSLEFRTVSEAARYLSVDTKRLYRRLISGEGLFVSLEGKRGIWTVSKSPISDDEVIPTTTYESDASGGHVHIFAVCTGKQSLVFQTLNEAVRYFEVSHRIVRNRATTGKTMSVTARGKCGKWLVSSSPIQTKTVPSKMVRHYAACSDRHALVFETQKDLAAYFDIGVQAVETWIQSGRGLILTKNGKRATWVFSTSPISAEDFAEATKAATTLENKSVQAECTGKQRRTFETAEVAAKFFGVTSGVIKARLLTGEPLFVKLRGRKVFWKLSHPNERVGSVRRTSHYVVPYRSSKAPMTAIDRGAANTPPSPPLPSSSSASKKTKAAVKRLAAELDFRCGVGTVESWAKRFKLVELPPEIMGKSPPQRTFYHEVGRVLPLELVCARFGRVWRVSLRVNVFIMLC